jgi:hypothetical protein
MHVNRLFVVPAIVLGLAISATPVFAEESTSSTGSVNVKVGDSSLSTDVKSKTDTSESENSVNHKTDQTEVQPKNQTPSVTSTDEAVTTTDIDESSVRIKGEKDVADRRKNHKVHTVEQRQNFCNMDKTGLTTKFNAIQTNAQRAEDKIGSVYTKAADFSNTHNLQPVDYAALTATVANDKTATDGAIAALVAPKIDCTSTTVATDVATFKVAADQARTDLDAYRKDVRTLIVAIKTALQTTQPVAGTSSTTTATGGTN